MNILITGGSSGLGRAAVELLAKEKKHSIWFTFTNESKAYKLEQQYDNIYGIKVDFRNLDSVDELCLKIKEIDLDVLVNNAYAGTPQSSHFHKIDTSDFLNSFENNLLPTIEITKTAVQIFKKKKFGKIINILTEYLIDMPPIGFAIYSANKAYLQQLSKVWNKEYTKYNITSNCISPAYMKTEFGKVDDRIVEQMISNHPLKKILTTEEVAQTIQFLINSSQQINGINITVNAGQKIF